MVKIKLINYKIIFFIWVSIWILFLVRGFIKIDYKFFSETLGKTLEEKREFLLKKELYNFMIFCEKTLPIDARYEFVYDTEVLDPVYGQRLAYYLYPRKMAKGAPYLLVFGIGSFGKADYRMLERFGKDSFILKKR